jgi:hypothetical protein
VSPAKSKSGFGRLHYLQAYSLPQYMAYSRPYIASGDEHLFEEVQAIAAEQERMARRLADVIYLVRPRAPASSHVSHEFCELAHP